jgi:hypothetical protein
VLGTRPEALPHEIGREERGAARPAMDEYGFGDTPQVFFRRDVANGVVNEHAVELAPQPDGPHVTFDVLAVRIQRTADGEHAA